MGGLNLPLAFNGVCKLYLRGKGEAEGGEARNPRTTEIEEWKREKRVEWMRVVKIDDENKTKEKGGNGEEQWETERRLEETNKRAGWKRHSWRLPHKLPKKAVLQVSVRV